MQKDLIFFGEGGITSAEAGRIANAAKNFYADDDTYLSNIKLVNETVKTINGEAINQISYGAESLADVDSKLERIGRLKALCAWLREAIAAKERLVREAKQYTFEQYAKDNGIEIPRAVICEMPITENDVMATFDIKKRNRYYYLEAMVAEIGNFIHKGCPLDKARRRFYEIVSEPTLIGTLGQDTVIHSYSGSVSKEELESMFFKLQKKHASYQKELNSIKSEIDSRIMNDSIDKSKKYEDELMKWQSIKDKAESEFNSWKAENQKKISALRIVIPNALKDVYDEVASLGNN
jgi:hypothetical protein